jgi:hypothetical protein
LVNAAKDGSLLAALLREKHGHSVAVEVRCAVDLEFDFDLCETSALQYAIMGGALCTYLPVRSRQWHPREDPSGS